MRRRRFKAYSRQFYRQVEVSSRPSIWPRLGWLAFLVLIVAVGWWIGWSPSWRIDEVQVEGVDETAAASLAASFGLVGQNIFRLDLADVEGQLKSLPTVDSYELVRQLPHRLIITLKTKEPVLIWQTAGRSWLVDDDGRAYQELSGERSAKPLVLDTANIAVKQNDIVVPTSFIRTVALVETKLPGLYGQAIKEYEIGETFYDLDAIMTDGRRVRFNILGEVATQLDDLARLSSQRPDLFARSSIDLRVDRWAYVK